LRIKREKKWENGGKRMGSEKKSKEKKNGIMEKETTRE